ncbi:hypothetical protein BD626DRAFT_189789 [Schizophyllum amplum]|uniref:Uncharacterized protein n=1 Tax=Schizophyllum amplum TaxID=97359 RepID=A0A550C032_9AGAR|nr:hypothetical protein BD626DRAFT_189789 [Auriculariopsis ampla]
MVKHKYEHRNAKRFRRTSRRNAIFGFAFIHESSCETSWSKEDRSATGIEIRDSCVGMYPCLPSPPERKAQV